MICSLMDETGTIRVRIHELPRLVAERVKRKVEVEIRGNKKYLLTVKTSKVGKKDSQRKARVRRLEKDC